MTTVKHKSPCGACPFRKNSLPGWLGSYEGPQDFLSLYNSEFHMPCHSDPGYESNLKSGDFSDNSHCAGSAIMMQNQCKIPRDKSLKDKVLQFDKSADVFSHPILFDDHHG